MKITEHRMKEILNWLDDKTADHALMFEEMAMHRDAAALIRQLQAELQDAWHAGLDAGREQGRGKDHAHQPPNAPVGVEDMHDDLPTPDLLAEAERIAANQFKDGRYAAARVLRILCHRLAQPGGSDNDH